MKYILRNIFLPRQISIKQNSLCETEEINIVTRLNNVFYAIIFLKSPFQKNVASFFFMSVNSDNTGMQQFHFTRYDYSNSRLHLKL